MISSSLNRIAVICAAILTLSASSAGAQDYRQVETRKNATVKEWKSYPTRTLDRLPKFKLRKTDPVADEYGGWHRSDRDLLHPKGAEIPLTL